MASPITDEPSQQTFVSSQKRDIEVAEMVRPQLLVNVTPPAVTLATAMATEMHPFRVHSDFAPAGDQPEAIARLTEGVRRGDRFQTLLGITGSGKSATVAWTIEQVQKPTLIIAPNKALGAQLANEYRQFFPENRVEYFVSYYDYAGCPSPWRGPACGSSRGAPTAGKAAASASVERGTERRP